MQRKRKARGVTQLNRPCVATAIFRLCLLTCRNTSNHTPFTVCVTQLFAGPTNKATIAHLLQQKRADRAADQLAK